MARVDMEARKVEEIIHFPNVATESDLWWDSSERVFCFEENGGMAIGSSTVKSPPLTEEERKDIIGIAKADPQVMELLDQGAVIIEEIIECFRDAGIVESEDGKQVMMSVPSQVKVLVPLKVGEEHWTIEVDLNNKQVSRVVPNQVEHIEYQVTVEEAVEVIVDVPEAEKQ